MRLLEIEGHGELDVAWINEVKPVRISRSVVLPIPTDYRIVIVKEVLHVYLIRRSKILSENTHLGSANTK